MTKSLLTSPQPQTFLEACDSVRDLQKEVSATQGKVMQLGKDLIVLRWEQGRVVDIAKGMDRSDNYGEEVVKTISQRANVSERTLYRCHQFYTQLGKSNKVSLRKWIEEKEEEKGRSLTWSYCFNWAQKALPPAEKDAEEKFEENIKRLETKAERLEQEAADLEENALSWNDDKSWEALGASAKAREVAGDIRRKAEYLELQKPERITDEKYLNFVRSFECLVSSKSADAHHLITGGVGTKGPDYATVPLNREYHDELHRIGVERFEEKYGVDLWRAAFNLVVAYAFGCRIDI